MAFIAPTPASDRNDNQTLSNPAPPYAQESRGETDLFVFASDGNWVVAPSLHFVMDASEARRARLLSFSTAASPHEVHAGDWQVEPLALHSKPQTPNPKPQTP